MPRAASNSTRGPELWPPAERPLPGDLAQADFLNLVYYLATLNDLIRRWGVDIDPHDIRLAAIPCRKDAHGVTWYLLEKDFDLARQALANQRPDKQIKKEKEFYGFGA